MRPQAQAPISASGVKSTYSGVTGVTAPSEHQHSLTAAEPLGLIGPPARREAQAGERRVRMRAKGPRSPYKPRFYPRWVGTRQAHFSPFLAPLRAFVKRLHRGLPRRAGAARPRRVREFLVGVNFR